MHFIPLFSSICQENQLKSNKQQISNLYYCVKFHLYNPIGRHQATFNNRYQYLLNLIHIKWVKGFHTSTLIFDIVQFFLSLNHYLLSMILTKVGFDSNISLFFSNYLIKRQTQYTWNNLILSFFRADIGIEQGSTLSPILSALYITLISYILEKRTKNLLIPIPISCLLFVDDNLFISQEIFLKNQIQIFFVVIKLFLLSLNNLILLSSMISLRFSIFLDQQRTLTPFL